ncbi:hypothetical protein KEM56_004640 [Ascosphaera pollenicola]|nr:hypothetical protein KEM56_004640 [Ascosphaera pollenicola]
MASTSDQQSDHIAHELLLRAHSPDLASELFTDRIKQKPLLLRPTSPTAEDNRDRRRLHRLRKNEYYLKHQKPRPLSAKQKRESGLFKLDKKEARYDVFKGLNRLWIEYIWEVLDIKKLDDGHASSLVPAQTPHINPSAHGSKLAAADFHGAEMQVIRCRAVDRVGIKGIVVRDTKFTFVLVTEDDAVKKTETEEEKKPKGLVFELHGSQFENRPVDRASRKFKWKNVDYL